MRKGVLFCTCGDALSPILDPEAVRNRLLGAPDSEPDGQDEETIFLPVRLLCSADGAREATQRIQQSGVRGLVIAACAFSARGTDVLRHLHDAPSVAGLLDRPLECPAEWPVEWPIEWIDIREGCAFVHAGRPEQAVHKAATLIRMGLAALERRPGPLPRPQTGPHRRVLIIGAGPAGLAAAAAAGHAGAAVTLVERRPVIGGMLNLLNRLFPDDRPARELLAELREDGAGTDLDLRTGRTVAAVSPAPDGFSVTLRGQGKDGLQEDETLSAGAVVLATGALPASPRGWFRHGELPGVSSQMELEMQLAKVERGEASAAGLPKQALFLQCVAARDARNPYCSAICCPTALKNAIRLKELTPEAEITVVHRNIVTPGVALEGLYRRASEQGVRYRNIDPDFPVTVLGDTSLSGLRLVDALSGESVDLPGDRLVLSTPLKAAPDSVALARTLGLRLDDMGFACGREPMLPLQPHQPGVFVCGSLRWPCGVDQAAEQGRAAGLHAALHVLAPGGGPWTGPERPPARIRSEACSRCGRCVAACPYDACFLPAPAEDEAGTATVLAGRCARCGACAAVCPTGAATLPDGLLSGPGLACPVPAASSLSSLRALVREALAAPGGGR